MRLLSTPYFNQPLPSFFFDPNLYAPEVFSSGAYAERFGEAVLDIQARGLGSAIVMKIAKRIAERLGTNTPFSKAGVELLEYPKDEEEKSEIKAAIAEWADGDSIAAHIGFGNDFFCTEDHAKRARWPAIFDVTNRAWLKAAYGVNFVSMRELVALLSA